MKFVKGTYCLVTFLKGRYCFVNNNVKGMYCFGLEMFLKCRY